jgi:hypothetical protein
MSIAPDQPAAADNTAATSAAVGRSAGSFLRHRSHAAATSSDTPGSRGSGAGGLHRCALSICVTVSVCHGMLSESRWYSNTPNAYTSQAGSTSPPARHSGAT